MCFEDERPNASALTSFELLINGKRAIGNALPWDMDTIRVAVTGRFTRAVALEVAEQIRQLAALLPKE